ncbi:MAG TPA: alkaline phosphatase D family protein [Dermatophilaceae bacterium]|nr:alkaline phosphatase D family protein [Dermatophilaceae bacterium]
MTATPPAPPLVLGPLLRYIGETEASVWVQTAAAATVTVERAGRSWSSGTFAVQGHHYALVVLDGLEPGSDEPYAVRLGPVPVWPPAGSDLPPPRIRTLDRSRPTTFAFGSCRTAAPHDDAGTRQHGVDALRAFALALAEGRVGWPDLVAFLGDQVYADDTPEEMQEFIAARRSLEQPPGEEIRDFVEYAELYRLAWEDPTNRWLLSTLPSAMIFDDHDIRDDWNTSWSWHEEINRTSWWQERLQGGLVAYWVYQHIGNLSPARLAEDPVWRLLPADADGGPAPVDGDPAPEPDLTEVLFDLARRADLHPDAYRWSYARDLGDCRLVVVDSRAGRVLTPDSRSMLDEDEMAWLDARVTGGVQHLFLGTSLPFLLPPGVHDLEAVSEVVARGDWGRRLGAGAEKLRQLVDLEHWAAFEDGFLRVLDMVMETARGERGPAPATITFLSGDVHHSYVAELVDAEGSGARSRVVQAVCSPIRNPMSPRLRAAVSLLSRRVAGTAVRRLARWSAKVPDPAYPWALTHGPWYDNNLAVVAVEGPRLRMTWYAGTLGDEGPERPGLAEVYTLTVDGREPSPEAPREAAAGDAFVG